jgi:hypothetical protein
MNKPLLIMTVTICACTGKVQSAQSIPASIVWAIADVEGGKIGGVVKEKNGQLSYGKWCISKAFLTDVNNYGDKTFGASFSVSVRDIQHSERTGFFICREGLLMIMNKRKCSLRSAIAIYNGGRNGNRKKVCLAYADRVIRLAKAKEAKKNKENK